ncbi:MAG: Rpn family recombination-promoting nuclease/putative transposase [Peptococcaceae bacterium]|nr:Rpn family recombination-promoting nuclease/putative transposase [Peptococcaceae bacterium]
MAVLPMDICLLPPSDDRVFKRLLVSPEAKPALMDLISAVIKLPVIDVAIRNNELPLGDVEEKAERLDLNCVTDSGIQIDIEMQASHIKEVLGGNHKNLKGKSIYYLCDLHSSQSSKGKSYDELARTYQITFCAYTVFFKREEFVNSYSMRHDIDNELLSDALHVVFVELSKLSEIVKKPVDQMTDLEKWAIFFRYADLPEYREIANEVINSKEVLKVAGTLLTEISQDERERAIFRSRKMYQSDLESNLITAQRETAFAIAKNMIKRNRPIDEIIEDTGLTREQVEGLLL